MPRAVAWGEIFGDDIVAVAMVERLIHHAELISTKGTQP
jgi:DNA replication protein DnaC